MYHSQNNEAEIVIKYFNGYIGTLLEIGANDGKTLSNSYDLIKLGWTAHLFEPGSVFRVLNELHKDNPNVYCNHGGIGERCEKVEFYESGEHVKGGKDFGLVSSTNYDETIRWRQRGVKFYQTFIDLVPFSSISHHNFDFISIDTEGNDWKILQQINLREIGCKCLCIEWNSAPELKKLFTNYCAKFGLKQIHQNAENLIFAV